MTFFDSYPSGSYFLGRLRSVLFFYSLLACFNTSHIKSRQSWKWIPFCTLERVIVKERTNWLSVSTLSKGWMMRKHTLDPLNPPFWLRDLKFKSNGNSLRGQLGLREGRINFISASHHYWPDFVSISWSSRTLLLEFFHSSHWSWSAWRFWNFYLYYVKLFINFWKLGNTGSCYLVYSNPPRVSVFFF